MFGLWAFGDAAAASAGTFDSVAGVVVLAVLGWVVLCVLLIRAFAVAAATSSPRSSSRVAVGSLVAAPAVRAAVTLAPSVSTTGGPVRCTWARAAYWSRLVDAASRATRWRRQVQVEAGGGRARFGRVRAQRFAGPS
jgi:hypothetical protein